MNYNDRKDEASMTPAQFNSTLGTIPAVDYSSPGFTAATFEPLTPAQVQKEESEISACVPVAIVAFFFLAGYLAFILS